MKVLITNTGPSGTGSFTAIQALLKEFAKTAHQVTVFFPDLKEYDSFNNKNVFSHLFDIWEFPIKNDDTTLDNFPLMIPDPHPHNPNPITYKNLTQNQWDLWMTDCRHRLTQLIERFNPDIIESNHLWLMGHVIHQITKTPYILVGHNSDQMGFKFDERMRPYAIDAANNAAYIFAISEKNKHDIMDIYQVPEKKIAVIHNGYDHSLFFPKKHNRRHILASLNLDIPDDELIINLSGKLSRTKGVDILLRANRFLQEKIKVHLVILGTGTIDNLNLSDEEFKQCDFTNVHLVGHQTPEMVAKLHNLSNLSVTPSRTEGFPIAVIEALGCGTPIVMTQLGGLEKYAVGGVVPQENPKALAIEINRILMLPEDQQQALSIAACKMAQQFNWEENFRDRLANYSAILS